MKVKTITTAEAADMLSKGLGPSRNWIHFLDRCRIYMDDNIAGLQLMPCCALNDGKGYRPRYAVDDVMQFIVDVREACGMTGPEPHKPITVEISPLDLRPWKLRKLTPVTPAAVSA